MRQFKGNLRLIATLLLGIATVIVFIDGNFLLQEEITNVEQLLLHTQNTQYQASRLRHLSKPQSNLAPEQTTLH